MPGLVLGIHAEPLGQRTKNRFQPGRVDGRDKPGHDIAKSPGKSCGRPSGKWFQTACYGTTTAVTAAPRPTLAERWATRTVRVACGAPKSAASSAAT